LYQTVSCSCVLTGSPGVLLPAERRPTLLCAFPQKASRLLTWEDNPPWAAQIAASGLCVGGASACAGCRYLGRLEGGPDGFQSVSGMLAAPLLCMSACVCPSHTHPQSKPRSVARRRLRLGGCPDVCPAAHVTPGQSSLSIYVLTVKCRVYGSTASHALAAGFVRAPINLPARGGRCPCISPLQLAARRLGTATCACR
jgi:hypothetical protein